MQALADNITLSGVVEHPSHLYSNLSLAGLDQFQNISFVLLKQENHQDTINSLSDVGPGDKRDTFMIYKCSRRLNRKSI